MQGKLPSRETTGTLLREVRPSYHLYLSYGALLATGLVGGAWLQWSPSPWSWFFLLTGLIWPLRAAAAGLALWGAGGLWSLSRHRLRVYERGMYQGPSSGRGGLYLSWEEIGALHLDVVHFPAPLKPLLGHYRIEAAGGEARLFPKLYPRVEEIAEEIAARTGLCWREVRLSREEAARDLGDDGREDA